MYCFMLDSLLKNFIFCMKPLLSYNHSCQPPFLSLPFLHFNSLPYFLCSRLFPEPTSPSIFSHTFPYNSSSLCPNPFQSFASVSLSVSFFFCKPGFSLTIPSIGPHICPNHFLLLSHPESFFTYICALISMTVFFPII